MKEAIIYDSLSGNTEELATAIKKEKPEIYFEKINNETKDKIKDIKILYIGTPIIKGMCTDKIKELLESLENKKIFLFVTAGYGGSEEYFDNLKRRIESVIPKSNQIIGSFFCQGKMPESVKKRYVELIKEHPDDKNLQVSLENFEQAKTHPDATDKEKLIEEIKKISLT